MTKVERIRIGLLGTLGTIVVIVIGYSTLYALNLVPGWMTGTDRSFTTLDRSLQTEPIEVIEFFSYACPFCANLEPLMVDWVATLPENVRFKRIHVVSDTMTTRLAKTYLVLDSQGLLNENHHRLFDAIHERNVTFLNDEQLAEFMHGRGIASDRFLSALNGRHIARMIEVNRELIVDTQTLGVPSMLIGNKFRVPATGDNKQMVATAKWIVDELLAGRDPSPVTKPQENQDPDESDMSSDAETSSSAN